MKVEDIARMLYMTVRAYAATVVNWEYREWEKLFDYERRDAVREVKFFLKDPKRDVETYHHAWMARQIMNGWTYDKEFDPAAKKHHYLKNFRELPLEYQFKDHLFKSAIDILLNTLKIPLEDIDLEYEE